MVAHVFAHIVTFNSAKNLARTLECIKAQTTPELRLTIHVTDNASSDQSCRIAQEKGAAFSINQHNLGFCAAHNQGVARFLASDASYLLILNPDLALLPGALQAMVDAKQPIVTPKLLRGDTTLTPVKPATLDAAGMILTTSLRHFDRGSNERDAPQFNKAGFVFGGTGACLLLQRAAVQQLLLPRTDYEQLLSKLHPHLSDQASERPQLFDEAFFAYREDAELAWRAQRYGIACWYEPNAVGIHERVVLPNNREALSPFLNKLSVRNRFLLQLSHFSFSAYPRAILPGLFLRNGLVVAGVLAFEHCSLAAFSDILTILPRALRVRAIIKQHSVGEPSRVARWLSQEIE